MTSDIAGHDVLVTGADGFIGSHLVDLLISSGANVRALVYYNSWNQIGWLNDLSPEVLRQIEIFRGDIRDGLLVRQAVGDCTYVMHLSSLIAIPYSYDAPQSYIDTNISGALNVLQACRESNDLIRLVHVSTSEVYGTAQEVPITERHPLVAQSPYSASKIAADKIAESFHCSFGLPVVTARPFNTYGPRQTARAVIPTIISQLISGSDRLRLGSLTPTRDFNYAADTAAGMLALALCPESEGLEVNIGTGREWSIGETVELLREITGNDAQIECDEERIRPEKSEVNRLIADPSLIGSLTGWKPRIDFHEGLRRTVEWVSANLSHFDVGRYAK